MISINVKTINAFKDENKQGYYTVYAKASERDIDMYDLKIDSKYKTLKFYGKLDDELVERGARYKVHLHSRPYNGRYKLMYVGTIPQLKYFENISSTIDYLATKVDIFSVNVFFERLSKAQREILWELMRGKSYTNNDDTYNNFIKKYDYEINLLTDLHKEEYGIAFFLNELEQLGVTELETGLDIMLNFLGKDLITIAEQIKTNPYMLIDKQYKNIKLIDSIALMSGVKPTDINRVAAICEFNLRNAGAMGKTWLLASHLAELMTNNKLNKIYSINTENVNVNIEELTECIIEAGNKGLIWLSKDKTRVASLYYSSMEKELAQVLYNLSTATPKIMYTNAQISDAIKKCEKESNIKYTDEQKNAVYSSLNSCFSLTVGAAGTGKSTVAKCITKLMSNTNIITTALSGKASLRLTETTNVPGKTMHANMSSIGKDEKGKTKKYFDSGCIIIDEISMVGLEVALEFFKKIEPGTRVFGLGDIAQLSVIGAGNLLGDLLQTEFINKSVITKVHRQALKSNITKFSKDVREQNTIEDDSVYLQEHNDFKIINTVSKEENDSHIIEEYKRLLNIYSVEDIMLLTAYKSNPNTSNSYELNNKIQSLLGHSGQSLMLYMEGDKEKPFDIYIGDRVLNLKNNYSCKGLSGDKIAVMNGSLGTVIDINIRKKTATINFDGIGIVIFSLADLYNICLGYAITIHKSQGSQAKAVIYSVSTSIGPLECCEQVYTAVTRAVKECVIIGNINVINESILKREVALKQTLLTEFLLELNGFISAIEIKTLTPVSAQETPEVDEKKMINKPKKPRKKKIKKDNNSPETIIDSQTSVDDFIAESKNDSKKRDWSDYSRERRKERRNIEGFTQREQAKITNIRKVQELAATGMKNSVIVQKTGLTKGTVSKYLKIDLDKYIKDAIKKADL